MKFLLNAKIVLVYAALLATFNMFLVGQEYEDSLDYFDLGLKAQDSGDFEKALMYYNKQVQLTPYDSHLYNNRGNIFVDIGDEERAMEDYSMALSLNPSVHLVRYNIGLLKFNQGLFGESVKYYQQELAVNPTYCDAHNGLGYTYYMLEEFDLAIESYKKALAVDTSCTNAQVNLENARNQKALNEKWKDKMDKYKMVIYDSSFNQLKELGLPSAYNRNFVASPHYIYDNWDTYSGQILKFYERGNKLVIIGNLKNGLENGYEVGFNIYKDFDRLSYTCQREKYKIDINYGLKFNTELRKFELGYVPNSVYITKIHDDDYMYIRITYKKQKLKITESRGLKKTSLFAKRVKDTDELLEHLKSKDYLSNTLIEQFVTMGGFTREVKSQEGIVTRAGFKPLLRKIIIPFILL